MKKSTILKSVILFVYSFLLTYWADSCGYNRAKEEQKANINLDKKKLENHAKQMQNIDSESANDANRRLRKNLGSD